MIATTLHIDGGQIEVKGLREAVLDLEQVLGQLAGEPGVHPHERVLQHASDERLQAALLPVVQVVGAEVGVAQQDGLGARRLVVAVDARVVRAHHAVAEAAGARRVLVADPRVHARVVQLELLEAFVFR